MLKSIKVIKLIYSLAVCLFITMACSGQDCNSLPQSFASPAQGTQMVKKAKFHHVDHIDTQKSSWIREAAYYSCDGQLGFFLLVTKAGREYLFQDMPIKVWNGFKSAESYGVFYNRYIRDKYQLKAY